jgi:hypothetical protein
MIRVILHELAGADARQRGLAMRAAAALEEAVNDPDFERRVGSAPFKATMFSDGERSWPVPPARIYDCIKSGRERGTAADSGIDLAIVLADLPEGVVGETTPGKLPFRTARWFVDGCVEDEDVVSPACHFIHEWLHVAGFYHCPDNSARGDVSYLVGDIVRDLLQARDHRMSARMARLLEDAGCGAKPGDEG